MNKLKRAYAHVECRESNLHDIKCEPMKMVDYVLVFVFNV